MSFLPLRPDFSKSDALPRSFPEQWSSRQKFDLDQALPFSHPLGLTGPPDSSHGDLLPPSSDSAVIHGPPDLGSRAPLSASKFPVARPNHMEKMSRLHHSFRAPVHPSGLRLTQEIYPPKLPMRPGGLLKPSTLATLPFAHPPPISPRMPSQGYHPSLTPIVELPPYLDPSRSTVCTYRRQNSITLPYVAPGTRPLTREAIGRRLPPLIPAGPDLDPTFASGVPNSILVKPSAEQIPHLSHNHSPSTVSTPSTPHSIECSVAARHRYISVRQFSLNPPDDKNDIVEILIPTNATGDVQGFPLHPKLLSHFSPVFRTHLQRAMAMKEEDQKKKIKMLEVKGYNYQNELAFHPRIRAGPFDFDDNSDSGNLEVYPAEDSIINVPVTISLPRPIHQPQKIILPEGLGPVAPKTFAALISWLYLGEEFARDVKAVVMIELWVLAGKLDIKSCQNDCIVGIEKERQSRNVVEVGMMEWAWANTKDWVEVKPSLEMSLEIKGSMVVDGVGLTSKKSVSRHECPLRNLLIDQCAWFLDEKWLDGVGETGTRNQDILGMAVLVDLVARLRTLHREGGINASGLDELLQIEKRQGGRYWVIEE